MTVDPRVQALCSEFGIEIVPANRYPDIGQTRAVATMDRILNRYGEGHFRLVMTTIAETANNQRQIDEYLFWAVSDLIRACPEIIEKQASTWLACFDAAPVGELQYIARDLIGVVPQRYALAGMLYERVVKAFGPRSIQPDFFDDRRKIA
jgi:hypothetical protein